MIGPVYLREAGGALLFGNDLVELRFDGASGCWLGLTDRRTGRTVVANPEREPTLTVVSGGHEVTTDIREPADPPLVGEVRYPADTLLSHYLRRDSHGSSLVLALQAGPWRAEECWHLDPESDVARRELTLIYEGEGRERLRHFLWTVPVLALDGQAVTLEAPGLPVAPHRPLRGLPEGYSLSLGDAPSGHPGLVGLCDRETGQVALVWPYSATEPTLGTAQRRGDGLRVEYRVLLAAELGPGEGAGGGALYLRANSDGWDSALEEYHRWYASVGLHAPADRPVWTETASLYELHIGNAVVACGPYEPLPTAEDLLARLPYIKDLGFDALQIMPHQYFPGYSVHDYYDVSTQYGDERVLRQVIATAHSLGMHVILDLVIHGCNDKEVARRTYERSGHQFPEWFERWMRVAAERSPYLDSHPEWFMRDEAGEIRSTYTWAFDHLSDSYQRYLIDVLRFYLLDLGVDGFRVDAPTWNYFPNWAPGLPYRAGDTYYGWARLYARARAELKPHKPDAMFYSEGIGPLHARDCDLRYAYDEQWLFRALLPVVDPEGSAREGQAGGAPITARELAEWLRERRLAHPPGAVVAHNIDSHDSFWPRAQFRRQVFGPDAWRPCFALCALIDGALMHYIGGELGNEDFVWRIMRLRRELPELKGACDYTGVAPSDDMVFAPLRSLRACHTIPVLSFRREPVRVTLRLPVDEMELAPGDYTVHDALNDRLLVAPAGHDALRELTLDLPAFGVAVVVLRPVKEDS